MKVGINSDMGEGFGNYRICDDEALMGIVSSANVACGFHAGDPIIMDRTVRMAKAKGVEIGAHPGLPDQGDHQEAAEADERQEDPVLVLPALRRSGEEGGGTARSPGRRG